MRRLITQVFVVMAVAALGAVGCSSDDPSPSEASEASEAQDAPATSLVGATPAEQFPDIVSAEATFDDSSGTWSFAVTVSSPYDTPERYADGWRVVGPDDEVYGVHTLGHDHAAEQPFTRRQTGVEIPDDVDEVTIEGRDQANGFGGSTVTVELRGDA